MNQVPNVDGKVRLMLSLSNTDKATMLECIIRSNNVEFSNCMQDKSGPWLSYKERMSLIDTNLLSSARLESLEDYTQKDWKTGCDELHGHNRSIPLYHIVTQVIPTININGIFSYRDFYDDIHIYCDNDTDVQAVEDKIADSIKKLNDTYCTDYSIEVKKLTIKRPTVFQFQTQPCDIYGNTIEVGDIVAYSPMQQTGASVAQIVGMSQRSVLLDTGSKPNIENVIIVRKYSGETVNFGY